MVKTLSLSLSLSPAPHFYSFFLDISTHILFITVLRFTNSTPNSLYLYSYLQISSQLQQHLPRNSDPSRHLPQSPSVPPRPSTPLLLQSSSASSPRVLSLQHGPFPSQAPSLTVEASTTLSIPDGDGLTVLNSLEVSNLVALFLKQQSSKAESQKLMVTLWVRFLGFHLHSGFHSSSFVSC